MTTNGKNAGTQEGRGGRKNPFPWLELLGSLVAGGLWLYAKHHKMSDPLGWVSAVLGILVFLGSWCVGLWKYIRPVADRVWIFHKAHAALRKHLRGINNTDLPSALASILTLLELRSSLEPIARNISNLPEQLRQPFGESFGIMSQSWANLLRLAFNSKGGEDQEGRLLSAFLRKYAEEERMDVGGGHGVSNGRHFVVTNFVAYSKLVQAVIQEAQECFPKQKVACRTALVLPLTQWFNFIKRPGRAIPFCEVHSDWENYIRFQQSLTHQQKICVQRVVLAVPDGLEAVEENRLGFHTETCMKRHARSLILVPSGTTTYDTLHPFDRSQLTTLGGHQDLKNIYAGVPKAYVILPPGATSPPEETNYKWEPVWRVFAHGFHVSLEDARYRKLTKDDIIHDYIRGDLEEKLIMPEDVFLVGVQDQQGNEPAWLFCLAADVDPDTNNLTLEFMMPSLSCKRFEEVSMYVKRLWEKDHWEPLTTAFGP